MATINAPSTDVPRQIQIEYARMFNELQRKLNERLYQSASLTRAIDNYNKAITAGVVTTSSDIFRAFDKVVSASLESVAGYDSKVMVNEIFPKLESYNETTWSKKLSAQSSDLMTVRIMDATRVGASEELSKRMTENVDRISSWSTDHYQGFQNQLNNAIRHAENTGTPINLFEIARQEIKKGTVPPNGKSRNRAYTIARDQTSKFNAALTRTRANAIGSMYYQWLTSNDNRVRDDHKAHNLRYFDKAGNEVDKDGNILPNGSSTGGVQPGDDVNCRCSAIWKIQI